MQWATTVEAALNGWLLLPDENKLEVRYENLLKFPEETLKALIDFLEIEHSQNVLDSLKILKPGNYNKWKQELSEDEIERINPILKPSLTKLGYPV
jgi:hypothetical protein